MRLTCDTVTLDQLVDELKKLQFAGYGKSHVYFDGNNRTEIYARKIYFQDSTDTDGEKES